jgi:hypothetical protein
MNRQVITHFQPPPCAMNMPTQAETYNQLEYAHRLKRQKLEAEVQIPQTEIIAAETEYFSVKSKI